MLKLATRHPDWSALAVLGLLFSSVPQLDLWLSGLFYSDSCGFCMNRTGVFWFVHRATPIVGYVILVALVLAAALSWVRRTARPYRLRATYLLLAFLLGPIVAVNFGLKEHVGRARPLDTVEFGGQAEFSAAFHASDACSGNCSFVSGHAAVGFFAATVFFLGSRRRRAWLVAGLILGGAIGLSRIVEGKHFASDVVFSFFTVYFVAKALCGILRGLWPDVRYGLAAPANGRAPLASADTDWDTLPGIGDAHAPRRSMQQG